MHISYSNYVHLSVTTRYRFKSSWDRDSGFSQYDSIESLVSCDQTWCLWLKISPKQTNKGIKEGYSPRNRYFTTSDPSRIRKHHFHHWVHTTMSTVPSRLDRTTLRAARQTVPDASSTDETLDYTRHTTASRPRHFLSYDRSCISTIHSHSITSITSINQSINHINQSINQSITSTHQRIKKKTYSYSIMRW